LKRYQDRLPHETTETAIIEAALWQMLEREKQKGKRG
jgi:hypothetical protein